MEFVLVRRSMTGSWYKWKSTLPIFRIEFLDVKISRSIKYATVPASQKCITDSFYILNTENGPNIALCDLDNYTGMYIHIHTHSPSSSPIPFQV